MRRNYMDILSRFRFHYFVNLDIEAKENIHISCCVHYSLTLATFSRLAAALMDLLGNIHHLAEENLPIAS